ncbi:bifunctional demethylmenaquinone methyltransferase/2-methoxy-6-polyprenyl-1,4-benzoquinol methylase UbiE [Fimbriiglobus ruber]|uniref:Demethylmenaquinone methyltransferase n=1 Tax=Fimbriiglobus ruber TaxID=1908690 RepID=A0A225CZ96_9BACT|nr:bifunctional demethylmenaquinone methyltransferase/2-methoxy-6-polyprenyl-1,4-benzoquinol methylase UbiE [Fimbriiglobus ruber]OWK34582.1 Ubiquinone/menaquinone biosynthesis methyltransferase UbiE [Fimbriiglobus ruber]
MTPTLLDKREDRIRRMFAQIAPWYDFLNHLLSLNIDKVWRRWTVALVPPRPATEGPILDLCTGTGDLALGYDRATGGSVPVVGADFCHEMLVRAAKKAAKRGAGDRITFIGADAQALPFATDSFQLVTVAFGLRNVTDTDLGLAEMVRVVRPGGRVAVLEFSRPRGRVFGPLYRWYFRAVLPRVGQVLSRSPESAYRYLPASVMSFPDGDELADKMRAHGLADVRYYPFTFGIATLYVGVKPPAAP